MSHQRVANKNLKDFVFQIILFTYRTATRTLESSAISLRTAIGRLCEDQQDSFGYVRLRLGQNEPKTNDCGRLRFSAMRQCRKRCTCARVIRHNNRESLTSPMNDARKTVHLSRNEAIKSDSLYVTTVTTPINKQSRGSLNRFSIVCQSVISFYVEYMYM